MTGHLVAHDWDAIAAPPAPALSYPAADLVADIDALAAKANELDRDAEYAEDRAQEYEEEAADKRVEAETLREKGRKLIEALDDEQERARLADRLTP